VLAEFVSYALFSALVVAGDGGATSQRALREGLADALADALRRHPGTPELHHAACRVLITALAGHGGPILTSGSTRALEAVAAGVRRHGALPSARSDAPPEFASADLNTLSVLLAEAPPEPRERVAAAGTVAGVAAAMRARLGDDAAAQHGCNCLMFLAEGDVRHALPPPEAAIGVEAVCEAMGAHPASQTVARSGCAALAELWACAAALARVDATARAVISAMRVHAADLELQLSACEVLGRIAEDGRREAGFDPGAAVAAVAGAMRRHAGSYEVQGNGVRALMCLLRSDAWTGGARAAAARSANVVAAAAAVASHPQLHPQAVALHDELAQQAQQPGDDGCARPGCGVIPGDGVKLRMCGACRQVRYCSRDCQVADWRSGHKAACGGAAGAA
jgi:hypothetical protein